MYLNEKEITIGKDIRARNFIMANLAFVESACRREVKGIGIDGFMVR